MTLDDVKKAAIPVCAQYAVKRLDVFGSLARGEQRPDSDVDLLVEFRAGALPAADGIAALCIEVVDVAHEDDHGTEDGPRSTCRPPRRDLVVIASIIGQAAQIAAVRVHDPELRRAGEGVETAGGRSKVRFQLPGGPLAGQSLNRSLPIAG